MREQDCAEAVQVAPNDGKGDVAFELWIVDLTHGVLNDEVYEYSFRCYSLRPKPSGPVTEKQRVARPPDSAAGDSAKSSIRKIRN
jgi:hypothetical protein